MSKFFINRPIVAIVIAILMVIVGAVTIASLPVAQFPNIAPADTAKCVRRRESKRMLSSSRNVRLQNFKAAIK